MTALAAIRDTKFRDHNTMDYLMQNAVKIYKGSVVIIDTDGYAQTCDGAVSALANGDIFAGICKETADNTSGADGANSVVVERTGNHLLPFSDSLAQSNVGDKVYVNNVSDDSVFTITSDTGNPQVTVGVITKIVTSGLAYVDITKHVDGVAAAGA